MGPEMKKLTRLAVLALVVSLAACSSSKDPLDTLAFNETPADQLYNEALVLANSGKYSQAAAKFGEVDRQHPYTNWAKKSLIMQAFTSYRARKYVDAVAAGKRFVTLYPGDKDAAYAQYLVAQSYFRQIPEVTRDQREAKRAIGALETLISRYPESEYVDDARKKLIVAHDQLAGKEMQIGRYYLESRKYVAAINRFKTVMISYQRTRHVEEALMRLTEAYMALGIVNEAQTAAAVLGHNFPDSQWYKDAYALLKDGGLKPREHRGSWISKAVRSIAGAG